MAIKHLGNAVFIDEDPITPADWLDSRRGKRKVAKRWGGPTLRALEWLEDAAERGQKVAIHPWVEFQSLERAYVGVALVVKGQVEDSITLKEVPYSEPFSRIMEASYLDGKEGKWFFEEEPLVEVRGKKDWDRLKASHEHVYGETDASYEGPGVYDGRDMSKHSDSAEEVELADMEREASDLIDYMFSGGLMGSDLRGDEWVEAFEKLALKASDEEDEEDDGGGDE